MNEMSIAAHLCALFKFKANVLRGLHGTLGASDTIVPPFSLWWSLSLNCTHGCLQLHGLNQRSWSSTYMRYRAGSNLQEREYEPNQLSCCLLQCLFSSSKLLIISICFLSPKCLLKSRSWQIVVLQPKVMWCDVMLEICRGCLVL